MSSIGTTKQIIFDFDGTLCKTDDAIIHCIKQALQKLSARSITPPDSQLRDLIGGGITLGETFSRLGVPEKDLENYVSTYRDIYRNEADQYVALYPQVEETISSLRGAGTTIVVLSNKGQQAVVHTLEKFGIEKLIDLTVGEVPGVKGKPDPEVFHNVIAPRLNLTCAAELVVVGDTSADIQFAKNIGAKSCWVTYGFGEPSSCRELGPDFTIAKISELNGIVLGTELGNTRSRAIPYNR